MNCLLLNYGVNLQMFVKKITLAILLYAPLLAITHEAAAAVVINSLPLTIQAESYSDMKDVKAAATTDTGGGSYVGWIDTNDFINYSNTPVNIAITGTYKITYRVASLSGGGSFNFREANGSAVYDKVAVPSTGNWKTWVNVSRVITLTAGTHRFGLTATGSGFSLNWIKIESAIISAPIPSTPAAPAVPASVNKSLPITIQAENYLSMSDVKILQSTHTSIGSYVGWIDTNDWISYSQIPIIIPVTGKYKITYNVASPWGDGSFALRESGSNTAIDTVSFPATGGWDTWVNVPRIITLSAGIHKFGFTTKVGGFNFNWFKIESVTSASSSSVTQQKPTSAAASSKPASSSKSVAVSSKAASSKAASSKPANSAAASSKPASSKASSKASSSKPASSKAASSIANSASVEIAGPVDVSWIPPKLRENGNSLDITELGGYQLRYKLVTAANYTIVTIKDPWTTFYNIPWLEGNYIFQIAAFDKSGRYSDFINILEK